MNKQTLQNKYYKKHLLISNAYNNNDADDDYV